MYNLDNIPILTEVVEECKKPLLILELVPIEDTIIDNSCAKADYNIESTTKYKW